MATGERMVDDRFYTRDPWLAVVEWRGHHEFAENIVGLSAIKVNIFKDVSCILGFSFWMRAPTRMGKPEILPSTIPSDPFWTTLLWRTMPVIHANSSFKTTFDERQPV